LVIGYFIDKVVLKTRRSGTGIGYIVTVFVLDMLLGVVAHIVVSWFSRQREYRADAPARPELMGNGRPMINALITPRWPDAG
jgi:heat shock protein HtpX